MDSWSVLTPLMSTTPLAYTTIQADSVNRVLTKETIEQASCPSLRAHLHQWTLSQFQHHLLTHEVVLPSAGTFVFALMCEKVGKGQKTWLIICGDTCLQDQFGLVPTPIFSAATKSKYLCNPPIATTLNWPFRKKAIRKISSLSPFSR